MLNKHKNHPVALAVLQAFISIVASAAGGMYSIILGTPGLISSICYFTKQPSLLNAVGLVLSVCGMIPIPELSYIVTAIQVIMSIHQITANK